MKFRGLIHLLSGTFLVFLLWNCTSYNDSKSAEPVRLPISRFEKDLFSMSAYDIPDSIEFLKEKYPDFFPLFTKYIIQIGDPDDYGFKDNLIAFTTDFTLYKVSRHIQEKFPDLSPYEHELGLAFIKYTRYFPGKPTPKLYSCISGFNQSVITDDSLLAISLDKYLGSDNEFYQLMYPPVPEYLSRVMRPERIVPDALQAWIITEFPYNKGKNNLLSQMIYHGRSVYCVKQLIPDISDTLLWGFTNQQLNFCRDNEQRIWEYLVENKKLFLSDAFTIAQFINDAPFTKEFSQESPGRAAAWLGYRIVEDFVRHNRDVSLLQLMDESDYQKIVQLAKYNP